LGLAGIAQLGLMLRTQLSVFVGQVTEVFDLRILQSFNWDARVDLAKTTNLPSSAACELQGGFR